MTAFLLDTHILSWSLTENPRLKPTVRDVIGAADTVLVSSATIYEIGQKVRIGKWDAMAPILPDIEHRAANFGCGFVAVDNAVAKTAALLDWANRDPFDRIIAATAIETGLRLISADPAFKTLQHPAFISPYW